MKVPARKEDKYPGSNSSTVPFLAGRKQSLSKTTTGYIWTNHARDKMRYYRLTESRIKRIIRHPRRVEEGILEGAVACMQVAEGKNYSEIWAMYVLTANRTSQMAYRKDKQIKIITAWRYPGKSPERDPIPEEVLREIRNIL